MALRAFVTSISASGVQGALAAGDDAFVAEGVTVASTDNITITADGGGHYIDVYGTVVGAYRALTMGGNVTNDLNNNLYVAKTGHLAGYGVGLYAVRLDSNASTLINEGRIDGKKDVAIVIGGVNAATTSTIENSGIIEARNTAILVNANEAFKLTNTGVIKGGMFGGSGTDVILNDGKMTGNVTFYGGADTFDTRDGSYSGIVDAGAGADKLYGSTKSDNFRGGADADKIYTYNGDDFLFGDAGDDYLSASDGKDSLTGGLGKDQLRGGAEADKFIFLASADSTVTAAGRDLILDFSHSQKDKIDLSAIDAKVSTPVDNVFKFIGTASYSDSEGELRYKTEGGFTKIYGDTNGDGSSDFAIWIDGTVTLTAGDFIL